MNKTKRESLKTLMAAGSHVPSHWVLVTSETESAAVALGKIRYPSITAFAQARFVILVSSAGYKVIKTHDQKNFPIKSGPLEDLADVLKEVWIAATELVRTIAMERHRMELDIQQIREKAQKVISESLTPEELKLIGGKPTLPLPS